MTKIKEILDKEIESYNRYEAISYDSPDPLLIARRYQDEYISLVCSLFAYGKASLIVKFLDKIDFFNNNLDLYYRFQTTQDVKEFMTTINRLRDIDSLENIFYSGYKIENNIIDGLSKIISKIREVNNFESDGYNFLIGKTPNKSIIKNFSPMKRWNLFLRWMVRKDNIDMGIWTKIDKKDLLIPLDTHLFNVSRKIGLLNRKIYDLQSAIELTNRLKEFDINDPVKYDFAIYRIGQSDRLEEIINNNYSYN
jgi:uncharacterized protein (TIGR02757 family)